jgi:hypothetical protein
MAEGDEIVRPQRRVRSVAVLHELLGQVDTGDAALCASAK